MLTQCPNCQTIFRVTSEILRVADGQVRCGRCQRQFDALERLVEEIEEDEAPQSAAQQSSTQTIEVDEPETHEDITMEGRHIEISGTYRVPDRFGNGGSHVQQETTEEWVEIDDLEDESAAEYPATESLDPFAEPQRFDDAGPSDEGLSEREIFEREAREDAELERRAMEAASARSAARAAITPRQRVTEPSSETPSDLDLFGAPVRTERESKVWTYAVVPLLLLLLVQWVHSYRATLARHPTIGPPLLSVYHSLGLPLTPSWDLHAYQIRQWGVISDPSAPGTLRVRASITNLADFAQPYPLLKLMLEDRWGEQIRARAFEPSEYLDPTITAERMLDPGQQANATIAIVDPGPDAEGFRFDVCLQGSAGMVCAEEVRRR